MESSAYTEFLPYLLENRPVLVSFPDLTILNNFFQQLFVHDHGRSSNGSPITVTVEYSTVHNAHVDEEGIIPSSLTTTQEQENGYARPRVSMPLEDFLQQITKHQDNNTNCHENMYLKDFHIDPLLSINNPGQSLYTLPECFRDDWLNWYWQRVRQSEDDYSFAYAGTPGTTTLIHHDVGCSYSWSVNLTGYKRWLLWPPKYAHQLLQKEVVKSNKNDDIGCRDHTVSSDTTISDNTSNKYVTSNEFNEGDSENRLINDARNHPYARQHAVVIEQSTGQALFVPSGWYHQVENILPYPDTMSASSAAADTDKVVHTTIYPSIPPPLTQPAIIHPLIHLYLLSSVDIDTVVKAKNDGTNADPMASLIISLNRNWFNGFNVREVWLFLIRELTNVRAELWHLHHPDSVVSTPATAIDTVVSTAGGRNVNKSDQNVSLFMNRNREEELLCMDRDEWYQHCDTILKANAATNVSEFVELLAARVFMMLSTKTVLQNEQQLLRNDESSPCTSGDSKIDEGEDVDRIFDFATNAPVPVPVPASPSYPAWAAVFCPRYDPHQPPSTNDLDLAKIQMSTTIPRQTQSTEHLLSTYHTGRHAIQLSIH